MRAVRPGSYSIAATLPGTPVLSRLKSMMRILRLAPPPRWRTVILPWLLRPDARFFVVVSAFSGFDFVISVNMYPLALRRLGDVGLNCRIGMVIRPRTVRYGLQLRA